MTATLVFVHGRGQQGRDPARLERRWRAGLSAGLAAAGVPTLAAPTVMPYYGDLLHRVTVELAATGERVDLESLPAPDMHRRAGHPGRTGDVERRMLLEMAAAAGAVDEEGLDDVLSVGAARRALTFLARTTRLDQQIITAHVRNVAVYLTRAREAVLAEVRSRIPADGPVVLISHSLGAVVARDLLGDAGLRDRTRLWVTAGAPLGLAAVQRNLLVPGPRNPGVDWLAGYDVNDVVALGHPLRPAWRDPLRDVEVDNGDSPHAIDRYLGHRRVAGPIGAALARP